MALESRNPTRSQLDAQLLCISARDRAPHTHSVQCTPVGGLLALLTIDHTRGRACADACLCRRGRLVALHEHRHWAMGPCHCAQLHQIGPTTIRCAKFGGMGPGTPTTIDALPTGYRVRAQAPCPIGATVLLRTPGATHHHSRSPHIAQSCKIGSMSYPYTAAPCQRESGAMRASWGRPNGRGRRACRWWRGVIL